MPCSVAEPPGDANASGVINVADVMCILLTAVWELGGSQGAAPACLKVTLTQIDLNCDDAISVVDAQVDTFLALEHPLPAAVDGNGNRCHDACDCSEVQCDDNDACTVDQCNFSGGCTNTPLACTDGDPCTIDTCDAQTGCAYGPLTGAPCDDGDACTYQDTCTSGTCAGVDLLSCGDGSPVVCILSGAAGQQVMCPIRVVAADPSYPTAIAFEADFTYPAASASLIAVNDGEFCAPSDFQCDVVLPWNIPTYKSNLQAGHSVTIWPADPGDWAGAGTVLALNLGDPFAPLTDAYLQNNAVVGDPLVFNLVFKLEMNVSPDAPIAVTASNVVPIAPPAAQLPVMFDETLILTGDVDGSFPPPPNPPTPGGTIVAFGGSRRWADGTYAPSCEAYRHPTDPIYVYGGDSGDGLYAVDPEGDGTHFDVYCDMTSDGGGWTLIFTQEDGLMGYDPGNQYAGDDPRDHYGAAVPQPGNTAISSAYWFQTDLRQIASEIRFVSTGGVTITYPMSMFTGPIVFDSPAFVDAANTQNTGLIAGIRPIIANYAVGTTYASDQGWSCLPIGPDCHRMLPVYNEPTGFSTGMMIVIDYTESENQEIPQGKIHFGGTPYMETGQGHATHSGWALRGARLMIRGAGTLNTQAEPRGQCNDILDAGESKGSGRYWIDPTGGSPADAFVAWCDMTTDGGGWTIVANNDNADAELTGCLSRVSAYAQDVCGTTFTREDFTVNASLIPFTDAYADGAPRRSPHSKNSEWLRRMSRYRMT